MPRRHTNRGPYETGRGVPVEFLGALAALGTDLPETKVIWFSSPDARKRIGELIVAATEAIIADRQQSADSAKWFRTSWQKIQTLRDGITLDAQSLPWSINAAAKILPSLSQESADQAWLQATRERHVATAAVFGLIWHQGKLYVMHAPHYSVFEDTNGDGVSDVRSTGLPLAIVRGGISVADRGFAPQNSLLKQPL